MVLQARLGDGDGVDTNKEQIEEESPRWKSIMFCLLKVARYA